MHFFCQHLVFVNFNNLKSCLVLSEVYSKLFILCGHSGCWFVGIFLCCAKFCSWSSCLEKKFYTEPKRSSAGDFIQLHFEEHQPVGCHSWRKELLGGEREERKSPEHSSLGRPAAVLPHPLRRRLGRGGWVGDACPGRADELLAATWQGWTARPGCAGSVARLIECCSWLPLWVWWSFVEIGTSLLD